MGHPKDIFKNRGPLTDQEIKDYISGNLSEKQRRVIELKMAQDGFNMDAMEGFEENPNSMKGFEEIQGKIHSNIKRSGRKWQFHHTIILSALLMGGTMLLGPFLFPDHGQTTLPSEDNEIDTTEEQTLENENSAMPIEELSDEEIEDAIVLDELKIVHPHEVIVTSPVIIDSTVSYDPIEEELAIKESIEIKKVANTGLVENIDTPTKSDIVYSNVPLIYMKNFLLVDYSKVYIDPPTLEHIDLTGTSPALENKDDELSEVYESNIQTVVITYKDFLRETQEQFGEHKFKSALKRYKTILSKYPEDLNAHFYSGLCYFNIGKYEMAIKHFNVAKNHPYNTFRIDAEWYIAKTYYQQGKFESCKNILTSIIEGDQYYSEQAKKLLDKID